MTSSIPHRSMRSVVREAIEFIRTLTGDNAYERYCHHHRAMHPDQPLPDRRSYYRERERRKWEGVSRCC